MIPSSHRPLFKSKRSYCILIYDPKERVQKISDPLSSKTCRFHLKKKVPIIVGGSGMYINSALNGISNIPEISYEVRNKVINIFNQKGIDFVYELLKSSNKSIFKIQKNDKQRLIRAYEVFLQTGKPISWWQKNLTKQPIIKKSYNILIFPKKANLYPQINHRLKKMISKD